MICEMRTKRFWVVLGICAACTLVALALYGLMGDFRYDQFQEAELYTQDLRTRLGRKTPVDPQLVLIGIDRPVYEAAFDEETLQRMPVLRELQKNFPWKRTVWAELIEKLADVPTPAGPTPRELENNQSPETKVIPLQTIRRNKKKKH